MELRNLILAFFDMPIICFPLEFQFPFSFFEIMPVLRLPLCNVSQDINLILRPHPLVPVVGQLLVHFLKATVRAVGVLYDIVMVKMQV